MAESVEQAAKTRWGSSYCLGALGSQGSPCQGLLPWWSWGSLLIYSLAGISWHVFFRMEEELHMRQEGFQVREEQMSWVIEVLERHKECTCYYSNYSRERGKGARKWEKEKSGHRSIYTKSLELERWLLQTERKEKGRRNKDFSVT